MTQDAYTPYAEIDLPISSAEDMFVAPDGIIYIADTGNNLGLSISPILATTGSLSFKISK